MRKSTVESEWFRLFGFDVEVRVLFETVESPYFKE